MCSQSILALSQAHLHHSVADHCRHTPATSEVSNSRWLLIPHC